MHNPSQAAHIVVPQALLGNATNGTMAAPGMGMKALLAKKMAKSKYVNGPSGWTCINPHTIASNPKLVSPTDSMVTPATQKLNAAKQKRFTKRVVILDLSNMADNHSTRGVKPTGNLFSNKEKETLSLDEQQNESDAEPSDSESPVVLAREDANPFE